MENELNTADSPIDGNKPKTELLPNVELVVAQLRQRKGKKSPFAANLTLLIITVILFFGSGLMNNPILDTILLIFVIFIHEMGHLIAMKIYGYKDVKMFFIPFLGAAVSGKYSDISSTKKAIITLAGPLPGIIFGYILFILSLMFHSEVMLKISIMFSFLNALNLLPIYPFDGGRFLSELFFVRNRYFELIFKIAAALTLIFISFATKDFILAVIPLVILFSISTSFKLGTIAKNIREKFKENFTGNLLDQKNDIINEVISELLKNFPDSKGENFYENLVSDLWERIKYIPPKIFSTVSLTFTYSAITVVIIILAIILSNSSNLYIHDNQINNSNRVVDTNKKEGIKYYPDGKVHIIASWYNGKKEGVWSEYDENTNLVSKYFFHNDTCIYKMYNVKGGFDTLSFDKLSKSEKDFILNDL